MATPIGHGLAGLAIYELLCHRRDPDWRGRFAAIAVANLPDADFIPGFLLGDINGIHHGATHSLAYMAMLGAIAYGLSRFMQTDRRLWILLFVMALVGSHVAIDWLTEDTSNPVGIPLFWPFSDAHFKSSYVLFTDVWRDNFMSVATIWHNTKGMFVEVAILAPPWLLIRWWRRRRYAAVDDRDFGEERGGGVWSRGDRAG
jgi:inner membrane protein